ncbi:MAG: transcriptional repressor LexA [Fibrobacteria bacterium]|nr:transcriptional repressor LexA [Fibrobacteria bacterium]
MRPLTDRQREVLDFIRIRVRDNHRPPTVREIGDHFDIRSTNGVRVILDALEKKGHLKRSPRLSRGLTVVETPGSLEAAESPSGASSSSETSATLSEDFLRIPLLGRVAAGAPILALENAEETLVVPRSLVSARQAFALKVRGDSMLEAGILDGDIIFAQPQAQARKGETVVALVGDDATVKDFYPEGDKVRLQPRNSAYSPIWVTSQSPDFRILGKVIGVFRSLS